VSRARTAVAVGAIGLLWLRPGLATGLGGASRTLGSGAATVARCDTDGIEVTQNLTSTNVTSVTVTGIAAACAGGTLVVTFSNGVVSSNGSAAVPAGGGSVTVTLAAPVAALAADRADVVISGP
jgi:hypothetical protein